ncbi:unnamed protein product [Schistosoma rodhaini]|uniref:Uncharacterized protein n=2 Tax=Schistosoma rodhaini TaxID=6188 RepID=A0AA85GBI7_9TREM|nr:unnamed protein product [Schistosoma rodhaini]CAH8621844.1 unnamed protein product [Schistosoma rodhaini]
MNSDSATLSTLDTLFTSSTFDSFDVLYTLLFGLLVFCIMAPTTEFISAGVTLENLFNRFLGNESQYFVQYHLKRTVMVRLFSSSLVFLYFMFMQFLSKNVAVSAPNISFPFTIWDVILWIGIGGLSIIGSHTYLVWYGSGTWYGHPTILSLKQTIMESLPDSQSSSSTTASSSLSNGAFGVALKALISSINSEYQRSDKFVAGQGSLSTNWSGRRFVITDSWILTSRFTEFKIVKQSSENMLAVVVSAFSVLDPSSLTQDGQPDGESLGVQTIVTVRFIRTDTGVCLLSFGFPASNLDELRSKLRFPLIQAQGVQLEPTIIQRFIEAFAQVVDENQPVNLPSGYELGQCIGCMVQQVNVTLNRQCESSLTSSSSSLANNSNQSLNNNQCGICYCRPLWCLECLARWFASRQSNMHRPTTQWLSGRVPCPTCRTYFCARDVSRLIISHQQLD